ncbi:glycosyltransferase family 4 protein [Candidatus Parcubacteria bacterium]|nr:glycosyltransferase family 4 protein [Candidatus Parcubacteria bacterium]
MNILIIIYYALKDGGASVSTYYLAKALKEAGHNVYIASLHDDYPGIETFIFKDVRYIPILELRDLYLKSFFSKIIKKKNIDIIHSSECRFAAMGALKAAQKHNIRSVIHYRGYWFDCLKGDLLYKDKKICEGMDLLKCLKCRLKRKIPWELYKYNYFKRRIKRYNQADLNIAIRDFTRKKMNKAGIINNVKVVYNPINITNQNITSEQINNFKKINGLNGFVATFIGKLIYHKGIKFFLDLMPLINKKRKNITFLIIGDGPLKKYCRNFIKQNKKLNIKHINFIDPKDMPLIYDASDVVVRPTLMPGVDRVVLETLSASKPIITSKIKGANEIIEDGKTGFLVDIQNKAEWVERIVQLMDNKELRSKMGNNAGVRSKDFKKEKIAREVAGLYKNILDN